jgi:hypothetical protein
MPYLRTLLADFEQRGRTAAILASRDSERLQAALFLSLHCPARAQPFIGLASKTAAYVEGRDVAILNGILKRRITTHDFFFPCAA